MSNLTTHTFAFDAGLPARSVTNKMREPLEKIGSKRAEIDLSLDRIIAFLKKSVSLHLNFLCNPRRW